MICDFSATIAVGRANPSLDAIGAKRHRNGTRLQPY